MLIELFFLSLFPGYLFKNDAELKMRLNVAHWPLGVQVGLWGLGSGK